MDGKIPFKIQNLTDYIALSHQQEYVCKAGLCIRPKNIMMLELQCILTGIEPQEEKSYSLKISSNEAVSFIVKHLK